MLRRSSIVYCDAVIDDDVVFLSVNNPAIAHVADRLTKCGLRAFVRRRSGA